MPPVRKQLAPKLVEAYRDVLRRNLRTPRTSLDRAAQRDEILAAYIPPFFASKEGERIADDLQLAWFSHVALRLPEVPPDNRNYFSFPLPRRVPPGPWASYSACGIPKCSMPQTPEEWERYNQQWNEAARLAPPKLKCPNDWLTRLLLKGWISQDAVSFKTIGVVPPLCLLNYRAIRDLGFISGSCCEDFSINLVRLRCNRMSLRPSRFPLVSAIIKVGGEFRIHPGKNTPAKH